MPYFFYVVNHIVYHNETVDMRRIELLLQDNVRGSDPVNHLYKAVNAAYPEIGLIISNSKIVKIQPYPLPDRPFNTYLEIMANGDVNQTYIFNYDRFNFLQFVENPVFDATIEVNTSAELITMLGTKLDLNFIPEDFWTSASTIEYCGGRVTPNWYMEACSDSVYWTGRHVLWLHPNIPDPESTVG